MVALNLLIPSSRLQPQAILTHHWEHVEKVLSNGDLPLVFHLIADVSPQWSVVLGNHEALNRVTTGSQLCSTRDEKGRKVRNPTRTPNMAVTVDAANEESGCCVQKEDKLGTDVTSLCSPGWGHGDGWGAHPQGEAHSTEGTALNTTVAEMKNFLAMRLPREAEKGENPSQQSP